MKSSVLKTSFLLQTLVLAGTCWYFFIKDKRDDSTVNLGAWCQLLQKLVILMAYVYG